MKCNKCGFENGEGSKFCLKCGEKLTADIPSPKVSTVAAVPSAPAKKANPVMIVMGCVIAVLIIIIAILLVQKKSSESSDPELQTAEQSSAAVLSEQTVSETVSETADETQTSAETEEVKKVTDHKQIYGDFLIDMIRSEEITIDHSDEYNTFAPMFELYDINDDGIEELFVSDAFIAGAIVEMYTIIDGELTYITSYEDHGYIQIADGGYLMYGSVYGSQSGEISGTVFTVKGTEPVQCLSFYNDEYSDGRMTDKITRTINDREVSASEFDEQLAVYRDMKFESIGRKYLLDIDTVQKVLGSSQS
ncbi:MAG: zinc ribbon domain-containing protein [Huintestinicola sp.]|uniref:zinc ribbon domain-containing protein n=1 Tax=Huintestinicola sp. TaxID=2981661 RepID=UPI003F052094